MAIDPNIKKKADDIRNKVYGKEVRESLASGLEEMSSDVVENEGRQSAVESRQNSVESQWQNVVDETTNLDVVSAPEIIAARDGEANLKARLDKEHQEVTAQLAQTTSNPLNHGAKGDGVTNDTQAFNTAFSTYKNTIITEKTEPYLLHKFQGVDNQRVVGVGKPIINLYYDDLLSTSPVLVGLGNNSYYENLHFNSLEEELKQNRTDLTTKENIRINKCVFEGFRQGTGPADGDAWGIYMKNSKRITLDHCEFYNNTQADIAITGGTEDILIMNPKGSKLHLNIEPNMDESPVKRIKIVGGHFHRVSIVNPSNWKNHIIDVVFESCEIDNFYYRGGEVEFIGCNIKNVIKSNNQFSGKLKLNDSVQQTANLIKDDTFKSIGDDEEYWEIFSTTNEMISIMSDSERGRFVRINPMHKSGVATLAPTDFIDVLPNDILIFEMVGSAKYTSSSTFRGQTAQVRFYDNTGSELSREILYFKGGDASEKTEYNRSSLFIHVPENATKLKVYIGNGFNTTDTMLEIESVSLTKINKNVGGTTKKTYIPKALNIPTNLSAFTTDRYYKGDILYNKNVVVGGYIGWVCIEGGNPGIWKGFGLIEV